jgi:hypothetical protein
MMRRFIYLILAICTASLMLLNPGHQQAAVANLDSCYGLGLVTAQIQNPQPQVTGNRPMQSFTLLEMPNHWQKLVGTDQQGKCFDYIGQKTNNVTLTAFMPIELATDLVMQRWSKLSTEIVESSISTSIHSQNVWLAPEDALALQRLGYHVPSTAKVLPPLSTYQFISPLNF